MKARAMELNPLFQNNAVLQCGVRVPVWGTARDGEKITVMFGGQKVSTWRERQLESLAQADEAKRHAADIGGCW